MERYFLSSNFDSSSLEPEKGKRGRPRKRPLKKKVSLEKEKNFVANKEVPISESQKNGNKINEEKTQEEKTETLPDWQQIDDDDYILALEEEFSQSGAKEDEEAYRSIEKEMFPKRLMGIFQRLISNDAIIRQNGKTHLASQQPFKDPEEVEAWIRTKHIGIRLDKVGMVCVDIDNKMLFEKIKKEFSFDAWITTSPRGGHFIFELPNYKNQKLEVFGKVVTRAGFEIELRNNFVTFLGPGYEMQDLSEHVNRLPEIFYSVRKPYERRKIYPILTEENSFCLREGTRNNSLFQWTLTLYRFLHTENTLDPVVKRQIESVVCTINDSFCEPPLPVLEQIGIIGSAERQFVLNERQGKEEKEKKEKPIDPPTIRDQIVEESNGEILFESTSRSWFLWTGCYWKKIEILQMQQIVRKVVVNNNPSLERISFINEVINLMMVVLGRTFSDPPATLINFKNGVFSTTTKELLPHSKDHNFTHVLEVDYDPMAWPDLALQKFLWSLVGGDYWQLNIVRGVIRRAIEPCQSLQTGIWIYGPPACGKTTFINWLKSVLPDRIVELSCTRTSLFERERLKGKSLVCIGEGESINADTVRLIKMVLGREDIPYDRKHEQISLGFFKSFATIVITSNHAMSNAITGVHDTALIDRIFQISFCNTPREPHAGVLDYLKKHTSDLINWALEVPEWALKAQIRVGDYALETYKTDPYAEFIVSKLTFDPQGFLENRTLLEMLDEFLKENGFPPLSGFQRKKTSVQIVDTLRRAFDIQVQAGRSKGIRGLKGIRRRDHETDLIIEYRTEKKKEDGNPFEKTGIVPYTKLVEGFVFQPEKEQTLSPNLVVPEVIPIKEIAEQELPEGSSLIEKIEDGLQNWWNYEELDLGELTEYTPWYQYRKVETISRAYKSVFQMPKLWSELISEFEQMVPPTVRNSIYEQLAKKETKKRSWFTCQRKDGIIDYILPFSYYRNEEGYPRYFPQGKLKEGKLGLLGCHKAFRVEILGQLNDQLKNRGYEIREVDFVSCHLKILKDLNLNTPRLNEVLDSGTNIWKTMVSQLPSSFEDEFPFPFLKSCCKRLSYKSLQGGRIDTWEKIYNTLEGEERHIGKDLKELAKAFAENSFLQEFDKINEKIANKKQDIGTAQVYAPMDSKPMTLSDQVLNRPWYTNNPCRLTSQVVTGAEVFELLALLETIRKCKVKWLPISLHQDGCSLLMYYENYDQLEAEQKMVSEMLKERLSPTKIVPLGLEFSQYISSLGENELENSGDEDILSDSRLL